MTGEDLARIAAAEQKSQQQFRHRLHVCIAAGCLSSRSDQVKAALDAEVKRSGAEQTCLVKGVGCMGPCAMGPLVAIEPEGVVYQGVTPDDALEIMQSLGQKPVSRLEPPSALPSAPRQVKIVLENSGQIDPERVEDYIAADGYAALIKALTTVTPSEIIEEVVRSGLRGRGGPAFRQA